MKIRISGVHMLRNKKGIIICGFAGIGKTSIKTAVPSYQKMSLYDLQSHAFVKDAGWQKMYVDCAIALADKYDYVFLSTHDQVIDELIKRNEKFYIVYPFRHCKDEYVERFKKRGNDDAYIKRFMNRWDLFLNKIEGLMHVNKIALRRGQYLSDVLLRIK